MGGPTRSHSSATSCVWEFCRSSRCHWHPYGLDMTRRRPATGRPGPSYTGALWSFRPQRKAAVPVRQLDGYADIAAPRASACVPLANKAARSSAACPAGRPPGRAQHLAPAAWCAHALWPWSPIHLQALLPVAGRPDKGHSPHKAWRQAAGDDGDCGHSLTYCSPRRACLSHTLKSFFFTIAHV